MPIAVDAGVISREETDGVVGVDGVEGVLGVLGDCEWVPEVPPPQPQLSDARTKIAMQVTTFMKFSRWRLGMPEHPAAGLVRRRRRLATEASRSTALKVRAEESIVHP
jgi:hypothetical protein